MLLPQKIQASVFRRGKEAGRRRRNRRRNTAKISYCFFFLKPVFAFFFLSHRSRVLREVQLFSGRWTFSNPALHSWTQGFVPLPSALPNSPTHPPTLPSHLIQVEGTLTVLFSFKNTDDKTHQYTTGGWEGR